MGNANIKCKSLTKRNKTIYKMKKGKKRKKGGARIIFTHNLQTKIIIIIIIIIPIANEMK